MTSQTLKGKKKINEIYKSQIEMFAEYMGCGVVVSPFMYKMAIESEGEDWVKKFLIEDKPVPTT